MKNLLKKNAFVFVLIVLIHVAYKMLFLDFWGFWQDEAFSLYFSQQHWGHIKHISEWDINPPLYYYFLWIWQHLFGISEYAIRFSSVIFSALAAGMLYVLCARNFNRTTGWLAALLFSISYQMYFYAHEARPYSLLLFLVLCSTWFYFELLRKPGWLNACALGLFNFALVYTHYVSGLIIIVQITLIFVQFNKSLFRFMGVAMSVTLLLVILRFTQKTIARILQNEQFSFWTKPGLDDLMNMFYSFFNGPDIFFIFLFVVFVNLRYLVKEKSWNVLWNENKIRLLYVWLAGPGAIVICFLISLITPLFVNRYLLFTAPFIYITLAWFMGLCSENIRFPLYAILGVFMVFSLLRIDFKTSRSMDYRNAVAYVKTLQNKSTPVLVETPDLVALFSYYYDRDLFTDYGNTNKRLREKGVYFVANAADAQNAGVDTCRSFVLTQTFEELNPGNKELMQYLNARFPKRKQNKTFEGITITVYSK